MRVVIGTGGTAGHVFPALATADVLRDELGADVLFLGRGAGQEARLVPAGGHRFEEIEALPLRRGLSPSTLLLPFAVLRAARRCRPLLAGADVVLGMGGFVSVPVSLAARRDRIPLVVHEQNAVPGLANRLAARWARAVAVSHDAAAPRFRGRQVVVTGNPVRTSVRRVREERRRLREEARGALELAPDRMTVIVFGGSQGATRVNRAAVVALGLLGDRADLQVVILTGERNHDEVRRTLPGHGALVVRTVPFLDRMELAYAAADLAVCRAGATTVAELSACGLPAVLIPYPHATGRHQEANARALAGAGAAVVVADDRLDGQLLAETIEALIGDPPRLKAMAEASASAGHPRAAERLAGLVRESARTAA